MLRHAVAKSVHSLRGAASCRSYASGNLPSGAKRALNQQQLKGVKPSEEPTAVSPPPPKTPDAGTKPPSGGDSGNMMALGVTAVALAVGGTYYYYNMDKDAETPPAAVVEMTNTAKKVVKEESAPPAAEKETDAPKVETTASIKADDGSNVETPMKEDTRSTPEPAAKPSAKNATVTVKDSLKELQAAIEQETSGVTKRADQEVMRSFDESLFEGLDAMSTSQLKAKIVQLAVEMKERTKWEALRLKEFLAMKEKETADKFLDVLQKQRLEFESILARRLMEQEHELTTRTNAKLQDKDSAVKELVNSAIQKLGDEHEKEKQDLQALMEQQIMTKYEQEYIDKVETMQQRTIAELEQKSQAVEALSKKVKDLEHALASSQNYHEDSLQAHKLSAAALALAEKMESNEGAGVELGALKAVAGRDNVIAAALSSIPASIANGVPTLPELQARFDKVASKTRQAALVPAGQSGVEGQLAGMLFATLKFPPKPDDPAPEDDLNAAEYVLVQVRQHVQMGQLEKAVQELDKLEGQAAFTVQGWKKDAADRVAVEQALKVIKMECALLNKSMSIAP